jgi:hypothetical protein
VNEVESAPSFYQQMQNEIQLLRNKVDKQLSDMVLSSTLELKTLTDQMKIMKEKDSGTPTRQSSPLRQTVHPNSPGSLRDLASPRNRLPQSVCHKSHSNALSVTSSASSRLREDFSRDITEPTTNLSRHASRQQRRRAQFESRSTSSSTSSRLNEVVSHDITEPVANLTRYANRRQREMLHVQTSEPRTAVSSMSGSDSSPICKEIVISSRNKPPALQSLASSPTEKGVALANDRLGQINEEENEDESLVEQSDPMEYQEIHEVTRKQQKGPKRKNKEPLSQPPNETYPSTRRGAAYDKYRTLNKETLLRPWRQKKNNQRDNRNGGQDDDIEPVSHIQKDHHQNTNYGLPLVQMVSSDDVSNPLPEETHDPSRSLSPIYDKARISEQYIVPPDSSKELDQNANLDSGPLSPGEKVYRQHENTTESGLGAHWSLFSMGKRKSEPSLVNYEEELDQSKDGSPIGSKDQRLTSPTSQARQESSSPSIIKRNSPEPTMMNETAPRHSLSPSQSPVRKDASPWQSAIHERVSAPMQTLLCGTGSLPISSANQLVVSPRQTMAYQLPRQAAVSNNYSEPGRQLNDPPDAKVYDHVLPSTQYDPPPTSIKRSNQTLPNANLLRAAMATSEQCAITIYPSTGTYHDAIVLKTYNEEKKEEESTLAFRSKGERRVRLEQVETKTVQDPYGDYGVYTGLLLKGLPYGQGTMAYADGRTYVGEWKSGRWHGQGKTTFSNGDVYIGQYYMDKRHGFGRYEWVDGRIYDGEFRNDQREGKGTYSFPDSSVYSGDFHKGLRHGQGCYKFADSSMYNGGFKNGKYDGVGECIWADGRCYRGEWKDGWAHGYGVEMRADGTIRHDGEWKRDKPVKRNKDDARRSNSRGRQHSDSLQKINSEVDRYTVVYVKEQVSLQSSTTDSEP